MEHTARARAAQADPETADPETPRQQALHREIARRYAWDDRDRRRRRPWLLCYQRLRELERIYADRYGPTLPDDDAGRDDLYIAAQHIAEGGGPEAQSNIRAWALLWCPWLGDEECAAMVARVLDHPMRWKADRLAWRIGLTDADRTRLKINTIGSTDVGKAARAKRRKERDMDAHKANREADRAARPEPAARTKPWEAAGVSRRTWYRRKQEPVALNPSTVDTSFGSADANSVTPSARTPQAVSVSAWLAAGGGG